MRNKTIDFYRGIAVILTILRHSELSDQCILKQIGWIGVDLFFVLSGFLVSGLIFDEYKKSGKFNGSLFLIRRGFKIYPAFWILILFSIILNRFIYIDINHKKILGELFFIQNYYQSIWTHTWSLAVEEHFYFLIVFIFLIIIKFFKNIDKPIFYLSILIIIYGFGVKLLMYFINNHYTHQTHLFPTHLRIDSLMIGLLIAYLYRFNINAINYMLSKKIIIYIIIIVGIALPFFWSLESYPQSLYMSSFGLSILSCSFGLLLIYSLEYKNYTQLLSSVIGVKTFDFVVKIGFYSYSIYLWHLFVKIIFYKFNPISNIYISTILYIIISVLFGILLGKIIEIPFLKLREKYFPKIIT